MNCSLPALLLLFAAPLGFGQSTWYVDAGGSAPGSGTAGDPFTSIQYAISESSTASGDTLVVLPGTYAEAIDFSGKALRIASSAGAASTTIESTGSVVTAASGENPGTELAGFTIRGGTGSPFTWNQQLSSTLGGGVLVLDSDLLVRDCVITGNTAKLGGGMCVEGGELRVEDCEVRGNEANQASPGIGAGTVGGGGIACLRGSLSLTRTVVAENLLQATTATGTLSRRGAGVFCGLAVSGVPPTLRVSDCLLADNRIEPWGRGGGIFIQTTDALLERCEVRGNSSGSVAALFNAGAGVFALGNFQASQTLLRDCLIEGNGTGTTQHGGGVAGNAELESCVIRNNEASLGGGMYGTITGSRPTLRDCVLESNRADHSFSELPSGAGAYYVELTDCVLRGNRSKNSGGAAADCVLTRCDVVDNSAGGLLSNSVRVRGGALLDCTANDCTIAGNLLSPCLDLTLDGGGAAYGSTLDRCLIIGNRVDNPGLGAATAGCDLESCTVYRNEYLNGWGYAISGPGTVHNTIVYGNLTNIDIGPYSPEPVLSYCNVEEGVMDGLGNISAAPDFWAPDRLDFHLRPGSPGIDQGDPASPADPDGSFIEIGARAFDSGYYGLPTNYCTPKINSLGCAAAMDFVGTPSLTGPDDFRLTASGLPSSAFAVPVWSLSAGSTPLGGGLLCVGSPFMRSAVAQAAPNTAGTCEGGSIASPFDQAKMTSNGLVAGSRIYAQLWYRDNLPDGTGFALTDGLDFTIQP